VRADRQLILVDHEVSHLGDPAFEVFSFAHLLAKAHHLPQSRERLFEAVRLYWSVYDRRSRLASWRAGLEERAVRQTVGCLIARAAGRSQLEYLSADEKVRQRELALDLIDEQPTTIPALVDAWRLRPRDRRQRYGARDSRFERAADRQGMVSAGRGSSRIRLRTVRGVHRLRRSAGAP
jgi:hypothetical protein